MTLSFPQWTTALDLDFTTQITTTISVDGTFNLGVNPYTGSSLVWTKLNSANEATAMQITNGTGLVIKPASATNISGSTFSAPAIRIPLNSIIPDWTVFMPFRIWVWISANNAATTTDQAVFGTLVQAGAFANQLTYSHFQGETGAVLGWGSNLIVLQSNVTTTATPITAPAPPNNQVGIMVSPGGVLTGNVPLLIGSTVTTVTTTIAAGSSGQTLPGTGNVINVASTSGFAPIGSIYVSSSTGSQLISYTGTTATSFTGTSVANGNATPGTITVNALVSQATWPALTSLSFGTGATITSASSTAFASTGSGGTTVPNVNLFLSALRNGSGTSLSVTIPRIRVDFLPINN